MKKIFLAVSVVVLFAACSSNTNKEGSVSENSDKTPSNSKIVNLTVDEKKSLNVFFSNFSEMNLNSFTQANGITNDELIRFGVMYNYKNNFKRFVKVGENDAKIKKEFVDESAMAYFGKKVTTHKSISEISYSAGFYTIALADGESYTFSQINQLEDLGDQKYSAEVTEFNASSGWTGDSHANPSTYEKDPEGPRVASKIKAVIAKDAKGKYTLLEYVK